MNILITGFQRSGTTLLRRILTIHPEVRKIFHESFLLSRYQDKESLLNFIKQTKINKKPYSWGEKVPYYPNLRKIPVLKYCQTWNNYFKNNSRIIHIIRHPYDVALSNVTKFKDINNTKKVLGLYNRTVPKIAPLLSEIPSVYTVKYEDLLLNPDEIIYNIFKHCGLNPDIDYRTEMSTIENQKYQSIDPSRAFAYKEQNLSWDCDLDETLKILNSIAGIKYSI